MELISLKELLENPEQYLSTRDKGKIKRSSLLAKRYGAESLLLLMAGLALAAAALVGRIGRRQAPDRAATPPLSRPPPSASSLASGVQLVLRAPYLRAVAGVVVISSFVTSLCGWQFKAIAQRELGSEDALAGFFGSFNAGVGLACLLVQALLTAGVVRSLGLRSVLLLLPLGLALGSVPLGRGWASGCLGKTQSLLEKIQGPSLYLTIYTAEVFPDNTEADQLHPADEQHRREQQSPARHPDVGQQTKYQSVRNAEN